MMTVHLACLIHAEPRDKTQEKSSNGVGADYEGCVIF